MSTSVLVLNSDYEPLNICNLHRAIKLIYKDKADILHYCGEEAEDVEFVFDGSDNDYAVPTVIRLKFQIKRPRAVARCSRRGIYIRDNYQCQICDSNKDLQVDHIQSWAEFKELRFDPDNCRTLCAKCHYKLTFKREMPKSVKGWGHNLKYYIERGIVK